MTPSAKRASTRMDTQAHTTSRDAIIADIVARTGIGEAMIERLVHAFYGRARLDPFIGPIFESKVRDWEPHIARICAFWSSVALMSGRYHGQPMAAHLCLPIDAAHFDRCFRRQHARRIFSREFLQRAAGFLTSQHQAWLHQQSAVGDHGAR